MQLPIPYRIREQQLWLSSERSVFWEEEKALIVSDLHFGKTGHFRKSGIAIPQTVYKEDLQRLVAQIQFFQPRQLIIVGDLFHSHANKELELFKKWRENFPGLVIHLIKGNHDILNDDWYINAGILVNQENLLVSKFHFIHDITQHSGEPEGKNKSVAPYFFSGHIHPGIRINGAGKQSLCFPCFYFGKNFAVLPAFSRFTGVALIAPAKNENVFAIVKDKLVQLQ
ncbi:MAG: ligase-associated DNA damage response endonuclease PdeM [Bacteroidetes bacterium]|nr:ligase-associated DNA damage response endonuclease PdeM [Bacteroidota bacterium]